MPDRLQILVSAVNKDIVDILSSMNIETDAVIVNQIIGRAAENTNEHIDHYGKDIFVITANERGVGLSRNTAFDNSDHEIIQFADDDIVYERGYSQKVLDAFDDKPDADILLFNVKAQEGRETYWNTDFARVTWKNYGRYPAYAICARRESLKNKGIRFSLLFGGGAPYMNGEDSLFLHDALKAGLNIYRVPIAIGCEKKGESTWFKGYTDKFFFDRGVLYHFLYGKMAYVLGFRFLLKNKDVMCREAGLLKSYRLLCDGISHGKTLKKV